MTELGGGDLLVDICTEGSCRQILPGPMPPSCPDCEPVGGLSIMDPCEFWNLWGRFAPPPGGDKSKAPCGLCTPGNTNSRLS